MDYEKYFDMVEKGMFTEAVKYKCSQIPNALYKYYSLNDDLDMKDKKIKCLVNNEIYLADFNSLNDLFEGKFLIFNEEELKSKNWNIDSFETYYKEIINKNKITCLSDTNEQNMPMWAYYANNHKGFCVKYILTDEQKKYIFPVTYEKERQNANSIVATIINETTKIIASNGSINDYSSEANVCNQMVFFSMAAKHQSWKHEKEYRIIGFNNYFPCMPAEIFIGYNCDKQYEEQIIKIGENIPCRIYKMTFDRNSKNFELIPKRLV